MANLKSRGDYKEDFVKIFERLRKGQVLSPDKIVERIEAIIASSDYGFF